jgi:hypothetical protein
VAGAWRFESNNYSKLKFELDVLGANVQRVASSYLTGSARVGRGLLLVTNRCFDHGDVDFHLLHHGCHRLGGHILVGTRRQLREPLWVNLP